jgi:hypothetical protein
LLNDRKKPDFFGNYLENRKFESQNNSGLKVARFKFLMIFCLLAGLLESNHIPVISVFSKYLNASFTAEKVYAEDATKEAENNRIEFIKDYFHHFTVYSFKLPEYLLGDKQHILYQQKSPSCFYPDVLTPPPDLAFSRYFNS